MSKGGEGEGDESPPRPQEGSTPGAPGPEDAWARECDEGGAHVLVVKTVIGGGVRTCLRRRSSATSASFFYSSA